MLYLFILTSRGMDIIMGVKTGGISNPKVLILMVYILTLWCRYDVVERGARKCQYCRHFMLYSFV